MSNPPDVPGATAANEPPRLVRGLGLLQAVSLNVSNMIGVGPFLTIPIFLATMGGPQALIGWIVAAVLVLCDGLVWSELGAALPGSGGTYHYLREIYGRYRWGRILPFLFIWQFLASGTLELASGYIGSLDYLRYIFPNLESTLAAWGVPGGGNTLMAAVSLVVLFVLCRRIEIVGWLSVVLCAGTLATVLTVIVCGVLNFDPSLFVFPEHAFRLDSKFGMGLGGAMLIAVYDYLGYYNICHLGEEVREPGKTIPRAVIFSVLLVAAIYLTMNICVIGVVPWQDAMKSAEVGALFMERLYGRSAAVAFSWMILWTALACVFVMTLGYSRISYAAARNGDFFRPFARLHPKGRYPVVSLLALGILVAVFCYLPFDVLVKAAVTVRILVQFVAQIFALQILRKLRPDVPMPFRMKLYPIPSLLALIGWHCILGTADPYVLLLSGGVLYSGVLAFLFFRVTSPDASRL